MSCFCFFLSRSAIAALCRWAVVRFALLLVVLASAGCATEDIIVSEVAITDRADAPVVGWTATETGRYVFSPEVEEVTIKVLFEFNYRGVYEWYKVEWIAPGGVTYQELSRRTDFGSHRDLKASLKVRGKMASRLPGLWRVRLSLRGREGALDRELVSRLFRIAEPSAQMIAAGLTPVDAPDSRRDRPLAGKVSVAVESSQKVPVSKAPASTAPVVVSARVSASSAQPKRLRTMPPGVLPPLAVTGLNPTPARSVPAEDQSLDVRRTASSVNMLPGSQRTNAPRMRRSTPTSRPVYQGCPPLYYRPGPDCIEQAAEE
ncbi:MAG: hypothetical protein ACI9DC_000948 [Gammaproteobacteria bacterium]|jgi:hypothetical protein